MYSTKGKFNGIQVLRAILFIAIVAFHCDLAGSSIFWGGIEIFFVISAFFFTRKIIRTDYKPLFEIRRRIFRLYPVYICTLIFCLTGVFFLENIFAIKDFGIHLLFSQNINWMKTGYKSDLVRFTAHTWTLSIEIWCFLLYVFAFKLCKNNTSKIILNVVAIFCAVLWRTVLTLTIADEIFISVCPLAHIDAFAIGSLLALLEAREFSEKKKNIILGTTLLAGIAIIVSCIFVTANIKEISFIEAFNSYRSSKNYFNHAFTSNLYIGFSLMGVGLLYFFKKGRFDSLLWKPLVVCGNISYSAYLIHYPICRILFKFISNSWVVFICTLGLTLVIAFLLEWVLTCFKKFMKHKKSKGEVNDSVI